MTVQEAKALLQEPLAFGNGDQIQALRQMEAANGCAQLIMDMVNRSNHDGLSVVDRYPESFDEVQTLAKVTGSLVTLDLLFEEATLTDRRWDDVSFIADEDEHSMLVGWQKHILKCVKRLWSWDAEVTTKA